MPFVSCLPAVADALSVALLAPRTRFEADLAAFRAASGAHPDGAPQRAYPDGWTLVAVDDCGDTCRYVAPDAPHALAHHNLELGVDPTEPDAPVARVVAPDDALPVTYVDDPTDAELSAEDCAAGYVQTVDAEGVPCVVIATAAMWVRAAVGDLPPAPNAPLPAVVLPMWSTAT